MTETSGSTEARPDGPEPGPPSAHNPFAAPLAVAPDDPRRRRRLRTALRWSSAAALFAVLGMVAALAVLLPPRTDLPGLRTPPDGRWSFPALSLPELPAGASPPSDSTSVSHAVDLRGLLLPEPAGAADDRRLPGTHGWYPTASFGSRFAVTVGSPGTMAARLGELGARQVAARGWTMPDGTRTEVYLVSFRYTDSASALNVDLSNGRYLPAGAAKAAPGEGTQDTRITSSADESFCDFTQPAGGAGHPAAMVGMLSAGDVDAVVVMTNPHRVPVVDFDQVVDLQLQMLA